MLPDVGYEALAVYRIKGKWLDRFQAVRVGDFVGRAFDLVRKLHPVIAAAGQQATNECADLARAQNQDVSHRNTLDRKARIVPMSQTACQSVYVSACLQSILLLPLLIVFSPDR